MTWSVKMNKEKDDDSFQLVKRVLKNDIRKVLMILV